MKSALIIVGDGLKYNEIFIGYLKREISRKIGLLDTTLFLDKEDTPLIQHTIQNYHKVIIASTHPMAITPMQSHVISIHIKEGREIPAIKTSEIKYNHGMYLFGDSEEVKRFEKKSGQCSKSKIIDGLWFVNTPSLLDKRDFKILVGDDLVTSIANILIEAKKTITFAESCTGGLIASELVKNSGVSSIFKGSIVSYANEVKSSLVGVSEETLLRYGAVSKECVKEMLDGVMQKFDSDFSLAVSGVAGPDGGSLEKPVGTIIIGAKKQGKSPIIKKISLKGDRNFIQQSTVFWAFKLLVLSDEKLFLKFVSKTLDK